MQVYDAPRGPVVHADFYRLRGPRSSTISAGTRRSPTRSPSSNGRRRSPRRCPPTGSKSTSGFDPGRGPDFRLLTLRGLGAIAPRLALALGVARLLERAGWSDARREFLQGDASIRAYERLTKPAGETAILMISPPRRDGPILRFGKPYAAIAKLSPDIRAFVAMADGLARPRLLGAGPPRPQHRRRPGADRGLRLGDDRRGRRSRRRALRGGDRASGRSARPRIAGESAGRRGILRPAGLRHRGDAGRGRAGARLVRAGGRAGDAAVGRADAVPGDLARAAEPILAEPTTWTLRDYHSPNLHWLAGPAGAQTDRTDRLSGRGARAAGL